MYILILNVPQTLFIKTLYNIWPDTIMDYQLFSRTNCSTLNAQNSTTLLEAALEIQKNSIRIDALGNSTFVGDGL